MAGAVSSRSRVRALPGPQTLVSASTIAVEVLDRGGVADANSVTKVMKAWDDT